MTTRDFFGQEIKTGSILCFILNETMNASRVESITKTGVVYVFNPDKNSKTKRKKITSPEQTVVISPDSYSHAKSWFLNTDR